MILIKNKGRNFAYFNKSTLLPKCKTRDEGNLNFITVNWPNLFLCIHYNVLIIFEYADFPHDKVYDLAIHSTFNLNFLFKCSPYYCPSIMHYSSKALYFAFLSEEKEKVKVVSFIIAWQFFALTYSSVYA